MERKDEAFEGTGNVCEHILDVTKPQLAVWWGSGHPSEYWRRHKTDCEGTWHAC